MTEDLMKKNEEQLNEEQLDEVTGGDYIVEGGAVEFFKPV